KGGQYECVTPLALVTSPEGAVPPRSTGHHVLTVRGVAAVPSVGGRTLDIPTGSVVVSIFAEDAALARAAARAMVSLNVASLPGAPLPRAMPAGSYASSPLASQMHTAIAAGAEGG
ncbi:MAG: hypothetical protein KGJ43_09105, partial [Acidobacteriota bacterium]|nr:hypothetical protein [Acidobacteriota bacterium]